MSILQRKRDRSPRDFLLWGSIVGVITLMVALTVPLAQSCHLMLRYHGFMQDVSKSAAYGRHHHTTTIDVDGSAVVVSYDKVSRLLEVLSDLGMGHPVHDVTQEHDVIISFGDGSSLSLGRTVISDPSRVANKGVLICYRSSEGAPFAYDTDLLSYDDVLEILL